MQPPAPESKSSTTPERKLSIELDVSGAKQWTDSGIDLRADDRVVIEATGTLQLPQAKPAGPEGLPRGWRDLLRTLPVGDAGRGALIGRVGDSAASTPFLIGQRREYQATRDGRLFLGVNWESNQSAEGAFHVKIQVHPPAPLKTAAGKTRVPALTPVLLDNIPRRVADQAGNPGDMVNFLVIGPEERLRQAFQSAGWVKVDRAPKDAVIHILLSTISRQAYTELPMSELFLLGRAQDFGFAHAEPIAVAASRHHLRLWKAPTDVEGQTLWIGAATHDIGFERDKRNGKVTHKIDPVVDEEREYVGRSLEETGIVAKLTYLSPSNPVKEALTATGGQFHSDGRVLVIILKPAENDQSAEFADLFCSVLQQERPDQGEWGDCSQYLHTPARSRIALPAIPSKYRVLIVPGVLNSCASTAPAFREGQAHLSEKHGLTVEFLPVPNESCEVNARLIAAYLKDHSQSDSRKYLVLGYSKGAPDLQVTLVGDAEAASKVAAFISVAGAVGGSPIADMMPSQAGRWLSSLNLGECKGNFGEAFASLRRDVRRSFLSSQSRLIVPTYSLAAISEKAATSKALQESWQLLSVYDTRQDGQVTWADALVPGATYLGAAKADHFAVAMPFEFLQDAAIRAATDRNRYPRTALLEAILRFVIRDLEDQK